MKWGMSGAGRRFLQALLALLPGIAAAQLTLPQMEASKAEQTMAEWLAHPMEFGVPPKQVKYLRSVPTKLAGHPGPVAVHLIEYTMPDGTYGRGFVNPVTWSFLGPIPYDKLSDVQLVTAYTGWLWLFPAVNDGRAKSKFEAQTLKPLLAELEKEGVVDIAVADQYKVGSSEFFEFTGIRGGKKVKGAGSVGSKLVLDAASPQATLPVVYTYLGLVMKGEI